MNNLEGGIISKLNEMSIDELKELIKDKFYLLTNKLNEGFDDNAENVIADCKVILKDIRMTYDEITSKYKDYMNIDEYKEIVIRSKIIKDDENSWTDLASILKTYIQCQPPSNFDIDKLVKRVDEKIETLEKIEIEN